MFYDQLRLWILIFYNNFNLVRLCDLENDTLEYFENFFDLPADTENILRSYWSSRIP